MRNVEMKDEYISNDKLYDVVVYSPRAIIPFDFENNNVLPGDVYFALHRSSFHGVRGFALKTYRFFEFNFMSVVRILKVLLKKIGKFKSLLVDGNAYGDEILKKGARFVVVDNPRVAKGQEFLLVKNVEEVFKDVAMIRRGQLQARFIGITGSCGKTTTRSLVQSILSTRYSCEGTIESYNCYPLIDQRIINMNAETQFGIFEMGISNTDENISIRRYCELIRPESGVITCIGKTHLEGMRSIDQIEKSKKELFDYLITTRGHIFLNVDDPRLESFGKGYAHMTTFGGRDDAEIQGSVLEMTPFLKIKWRPSLKSHDIHILQTRLFGAYNLNNILAAIAIGLHYDIPMKLIHEAIEAFEPIGLRSQVIEKNSQKIFVDAFNANPTSMKASLESFCGIKSRRKIAIIGDMLELGRSSHKEHQDIVFFCKDLNFDTMVFIGKEFLHVKDKNAGLFFPDTRRARNWIKKQNFTDSDIFLKGSRGVSLEKLLPFI